MNDQPDPPDITLKEFLEGTPPGQWGDVIDLSELESPSKGHRYLQTPRLQLYCKNDECRGYRFFSTTRYSEYLKPSTPEDKFLVYMCGNCRKSFKTFALRVGPASYSNDSGRIYKYGETPPFGPPIPAKAIRLVEPDKDLFLTGRRAENQGMGIAAFAYYRRVVENQKNRIFDEVIRVTKKLIPDDPVLEELEKAKEEIQFTKAVEVLKHSLPQSIFINGHNPLTLLHAALSEGVHGHTDAECLELATSIRTILVEFALRLGQALKEEAELSAAVNRLTKKRV